MSPAKPILCALMLFCLGCRSDILQPAVSHYGAGAAEPRFASEYSEGEWWALKSAGDATISPSPIAQSSPVVVYSGAALSGNSSASPASIIPVPQAKLMTPVSPASGGGFAATNSSVGESPVLPATASPLVGVMNAMVQPPDPKAPPTPPATPAQPVAQPAAPPLPSLPDLSAGNAKAGPTAAQYLDSAIPFTNFRVRYSAGYGMNRPDRSEYFYAAWQELGYHVHGINGQGPYYDPKVKGPPALPGQLNFQDITPYFEFTVDEDKRLSLFIEMPYRTVTFKKLQEDPEHPIASTTGKVLIGTDGKPVFLPEPHGGNEVGETSFSNSGFADINFGFKYAMIADPNRYLTAQLRTYAPTGNAVLGLGTGHFSLEPGLLAYQGIGRWSLLGQFSDWIPLGGSKSVLDGRSFDGNILNYGFGLAYNLYSQGKITVVPITEVVGWTVLGGLASVAESINATFPPGLPYPQTPANLPPGIVYPVPGSHGLQDATGNTIVDVKIGVRAYYGPASLYVGYGRAVTGNYWYTDLFRVEARWAF